MTKIKFTYFIILVCVVLVYENTTAQEFPVAVGSDTTFSGGAVYGGLNGIVAVLGDNNSQYYISAQLVGAGGILIGPRISLGDSGVMPGAIPIFDGTNYFLIWRDYNENLKGQFLNTSGELVGSSLIISTNVSIQRPGSYGIALSDTMFLIVFTKNDNVLYGQMVGKSGNLIGGQIHISNNLAREVSLAYDNTNFLVTWVEIIPDTDKDIYGQFVSKTGSLIGNNFLIDGGPYYSDNPSSLAFDGTRYLLVYHDSPAMGSNWFIKGCFISTSGVIEENITICDASLAPIFASVAFDNENYFITWTQLTDMTLRGRFYDKTGVPIDSSFVVISPSVNKLTVGGVGFGGGLYLVVATKVDSNFSDGDVYARFISPLSSADDNDKNLSPEKITLYQNYPNPFNPETSINFNLPEDDYITLKIYDISGKLIHTLVEDYKLSGHYSIKWNGENENGEVVSSGLYLYQITSSKYSITKGMLILK